MPDGKSAKNLKQDSVNDGAEWPSTATGDVDDSSAPRPGPTIERPLIFLPRRRLLGAGAGAAVGLSLGLHRLEANAAKPANRMRPQPGDVVVHRFGDLKGKPVLPEHVPEGNLLLQAVTAEPETGLMRDGSRLNGLNLVRVDESAMDDKTRPFSAAGIVAYSSVCTHQGCDLTQWVPTTQTFKCYCHYSEFDATKMGKPQHGPARRRLAILPIAQNEKGEFVVADKFVGKVGFKKK